MDKADSNLDFAIKIFIEDKQYAPAILIAGAAEDDFAKIIEENNKDHVLNLVKNSFLENEGIAKKDTHDKINRVKNWLKHGDTPTLEYDEPLEAIQYILRAINNYWIINGKYKLNHKSFFKYVKENWPEINGIESK